MPHTSKELPAASSISLAVKSSGYFPMAMWAPLRRSSTPCMAVLLMFPLAVYLGTLLSGEPNEQRQRMAIQDLLELRGDDGISREAVANNNTVSHPNAPPNAANTGATDTSAKRTRTVGQNKVTLAGATDSQESRMEAMRRACWNRPADKSVEDLSWSVRDHIHVHDEFKVMFCLVPKVGCTNMKRLFINISNHGNDPAEVAGFPHSYRKMARAGVYPLDHFKGENRTKRIKEYYKVILIRHPFIRLLSAYRNKFVEPNPLYPKSTGTKIIARYRENATQKSLLKGHDVHYDEFVQYLIDIGHTHNKFDQHWAPYTHLCDPCNVHYDYVMKLETMDSDMAYIRDKVYNGSLDATLPPAYKKPTENEMIKKYYSTVGEIQLRNLTEVFQDDFTMYGYDTELSSIVH